MCIRDRANITSAFYFDNLSALEVLTAADVESETGPPPPAPAPPYPSVHYSSLASDRYYYYPFHRPFHHSLNERTFRDRTSGSFNRDHRIRKEFIDSPRRSSLGVGLTSNPEYSSSLKRHSKLNEPPISTDVFYKGMTSGGLDSTSRIRSSSHRTTGQSPLLCRWDSGGALLPPASSCSCVPPIKNNTSNFSREAQSLPSTPNANKRLVSSRIDRKFRTDLGPERRTLAVDHRDYREIRNLRDHSDHSLLPVPVSVPPPPASGISLTNHCYQNYGHSNSNTIGNCSGINLSESAVLAGNSDSSRTRDTRVKTLNQLACLLYTSDAADE